MSQSSSADAAPPAALPAQRGAGSALAPRNRRVAWLIVLVAIPTVLGLALSGLKVTDATRTAAAYGQVSRLAVLGQQVTGLTQAMEDERAGTAAFIADGRPAAGLTALRRQYAITDGWAAAVRRLVLRSGRDYPAQPRASTAKVLASIAELPGLRRHAAQRQAPALAVINGYAAATAGLLPVNDGIADLSGNSALITSVRALGSLSRMKDQASEQQAILGAALAEGRFGPGALTALTTAQAQQASDLITFRSSATPEESWALTGTLAGPLAGQARAVEQRATAAGNGALSLGAHARQQWQAGMSYTLGWMRHAEQQLTSWITAYARALQRSAMRSAIITGGAALAVLAVALLATLLIARSILRPLRRLEAAAPDVAGGRLPAEAGEEAQQRGSVNAVFASFFLRSHFLLERLLRLIDSSELREDDPERLASLFQIDHLATRMRRNSDSALVLAGHETPRRWTEPVTLLDVLRAAVSEIEQYDRVSISVQQGVSVSESAAADTVHLLAELLENATTFSAKTTRAIVCGHTVRDGGLLISIVDGGMGMPEDQLRQLNWRLAHPPIADVAVTPQMGLFAVAHLAARHGIKVTLGLPPGGGITAEVHLPAALISQQDRRGGWPGQTGEALQATAGRGAGAAAAVPLTLGAPLPSPAPAASFAVTVPEPEGAEAGGALPIFDSVESDYFPARGRASAGLPRRIRQANLGPGAAADQEPRQAQAAESAQIALGRLASFQRGSRRARAVTRMDRDAKQPVQDH